MTTYKPRSDKRVEARQWKDRSMAVTDRLPQLAEHIVAWVNDNGGEARYDHAGPSRSDAHRIAVCTINGWAYAAPGHYVVMGSEWFRPSTGRETRAMQISSDALRDFYPCDPATFESRWEVDA